MAEEQGTDTYDERLDLVEVGGAAVYEDVIGSLEAEVGEALYPGDERRVFGEALVAVLMAYVSKANDAARQTLLRFARGQALDAIGERLGVERIAAGPASCTLRFTLSAPRPVAITIPVGTRATPDGALYFATVEACAVPAGETSAEARAECQTAGEAGNGIEAGAISTLVDLQPYVATVENVDDTAGGDEGEPYTEEGDDRLRERIRIAPNSLSTAGPEQAYVYWALTADPGIADVRAFSEEHDEVRERPVEDGRVRIGGDLLEPDELLLVEGEPSGFTWSYEDSLLTIELEGDAADADSVEVAVRRRMDGRVKVVPLMEGGGMPGEETLRAVSEAVNGRAVRPMTDLVTVEAPVPVEYGISMRYWTTATDEAAVVQAVEGAGGAIERYIAEQGSVLGRDVNPDMLHAYVMEAGAIRCEVDEPAYTAVADYQVARLSGEPAAEHELETRARWSE